MRLTYTLQGVRVCTLAYPHHKMVPYDYKPYKVSNDGVLYIELKYKSTTDIMRIGQKDGLIYKIEITQN